MLNNVVCILDHVVRVPICFGLFISVNIILVVEFLYQELVLAGLECFEI